MLCHLRFFLLAGKFLIEILLKQFPLSQLVCSAEPLQEDWSTKAVRSMVIISNYSVDKTHRTKRRTQNKMCRNNVALLFFFVIKHTLDLIFYQYKLNDKFPGYFVSEWNADASPPKKHYYSQHVSHSDTFDLLRTSGKTSSSLLVWTSWIIFRTI